MATSRHLIANIGRVQVRPRSEARGDTCELLPKRNQILYLRGNWWIQADRAIILHIAWIVQHLNATTETAWAKVDTLPQHAATFAHRKVESLWDRFLYWWFTTTDTCLLQSTYNIDGRSTAIEADGRNNRSDITIWSLQARRRMATSAHYFLFFKWFFWTTDQSARLFSCSPTTKRSNECCHFIWKLSRHHHTYLAPKQNDN